MSPEIGKSRVLRFRQMDDSFQKGKKGKKGRFLAGSGQAPRRLAPLGGRK